MASEVAPVRTTKKGADRGLERPAERGACVKCGAPAWFWPEDTTHLCAKCAFDAPRVVREKIVG